MAEISQGVPLKNQKISTDDRSSPMIDSSLVLKASPRGAVNLEAMIAVKKRSDLNHVETNDKSAPFIEKDVTVGTFKGKELMAEVAKGKSLNPVETDDKSAPAVESDVKIKPNPRVALLNDVCKKQAPTGEGGGSLSGLLNKIESATGLDVNGDGKVGGAAA